MIAMPTYSDKYIEKWIGYLNSIDRDMNRLAPEKLGRTKNPVVVPELIKSLQNRPDDIRIGAARALGEIGDPAAVRHLIPLLKDENPLVASTAADSLGAIGDPAATKGLVEFLRDFKSAHNRHRQIHGFDRGVYIACANALRRIGTREAQKGLERYYTA